ncbi:MAG: hypothetical protein PUC88_01660 [Clostridia bacterium]|nr:hypothetical protein [Clostridia bacterium]
MKRIVCILVICSLLFSVITSASATSVHKFNGLDHAGTRNTNSTPDTESDIDLELSDITYDPYRFIDPTYGDQTEDNNVLWLPEQGEYAWRTYLRDFCEFILERYESQSNGSVEQKTNFIDLYDFSDAFKIAQGYLSNENTINSMTEKEALNNYRRLYNTAKSKIFFQAYALTYEACLEEDNFNNFYNKEFWNNVTEFLNSDAKIIYDKKIVSRAELRDICFLHSCIIDEANKGIPYDLNKDNVLNLMDVVMAQKYLVGIINLTRTQKQSISTYEYDDASMQTVTLMQKSIADLIDIYDENATGRINNHGSGAKFVFYDFTINEHRWSDVETFRKP